MNFSVKNPQRKSSMCYFYTRNYKNKRMAGGARCAQPGLLQRQLVLCVDDGYYFKCIILSVLFLYVYKVCSIKILTF